jgi:inner membrane transporter RhtA
VVGLVTLAQVPGLLEAAGIAAVVGAVLLRSRDGDVPAAVGRT